MTPSGGVVQAPALVTLTNLNGAGRIFYTLDGSDPRDALGFVATNARVHYAPVANQVKYVPPLSVNRSMMVRARVKDGTHWSDLVAAPFTVDQDFSQLLFTEISYHAHELPTQPYADDLYDFLELKNVGARPLDVSGLEIFSFAGVNRLIYTFPPSTVIRPGEFHVLISSTNEFRTRFPSVPIHGAFIEQLNQGFSELVIRGTNGAFAASMRFDSHAPWQALPDNHGYFGPETGFSLVRTNFAPAADARDFRLWHASAVRGGTPGKAEPALLNPIPPIVITEILTRSGNGLKDAVELFNPTATNVHLGGWWLTDQRNEPQGVRIPHGTMIPAEGYLVLDQDDFDLGPSPFSLDADGERCYLFSGDMSGNLTGYSHGFLFAGSDRDVSFGRHVTSEGLDYLLPQKTLTFGTSNSGPILPPLLINEIKFKTERTEVDFVELHSTSNGPLTLWDPNRPENLWNFDLALSSTIFVAPTFLPPITVPALGYVLLVSGSSNEFRARYSVPDSVQVISLPNNLTSAQIVPGFRLFRPSGQTDGRPRYLLVDEVRLEEGWIFDYGPLAPWESGMEAEDSSWERIADTPFGNEPQSWRAAASGPTPGRDNATNVPPVVWAGGPRTNFVGYPGVVRGALRDDHWPGTALTSWWTQVSGPASVVLSNSLPSNPTATFTETGEYVMRFTASDGVWTRSDETVIQAISRPFDLWRGTNFDAEELANENISASDADPDGDGRRNIEEYLLLSPPKVPNGGPRTTTFLTNGLLTIVWLQRSDVSDVEVIPELAEGLDQMWFGGPGLFRREETPGPTSGTVQVTLTCVIAPGAAQRFVRLALRFPD